MDGLKSVILAILPEISNWLDWPSPVRAAIQNRQQDFIFSFIFQFAFIFSNIKPLPEVPPGFLVIQIQIEAVCGGSSNCHSLMYTPK
jgi:hypothetical protein